MLSSSFFVSGPEIEFHEGDFCFRDCFTRKQLNSLLTSVLLDTSLFVSICDLVPVSTG